MVEARQARVFGRGAIPPAPSPARVRVYRPRGERVPSAAKAAIAAARPRDARGHFLPVVGDAVRPATVRGGGDTAAGDFGPENGVEVV